MDRLESERRVFGRLLYFFAAWTLTIKYVIPVGWAMYEMQSLTTYIYFWDAWWIFHLWVGRGLKTGRKGIRRWAVLLSAAEILVIAVKLSLYVLRPNLDFWHINWFSNKACMLVFFIALSVWLFRKDVKEAL